MKALLLENLQIDYCPGGSMEIPEGDQLVPLANQLMSLFDYVIASIDWHPANHLSFAANHPWRRFGQVVKVADLALTLMPIHCVQGTFGAAFYPGLKQNGIHKIIRKGTNVNIDNASSFFDADKRLCTGLDDFLKEKEIKNLSILGMPLETSVLASAQDALDLGYSVTIIKEACKGWLSIEEAEQLYEQMRQQGAIVSR